MFLVSLLIMMKNLTPSISDIHLNFSSGDLLLQYFCNIRFINYFKMKKQSRNVKRMFKLTLKKDTLDWLISWNYFNI
jgi:hypothetical protein